MPFLIVRNDITAMKVDCIVNSANPNVTVGTGVDSAIYEKGGKELFEERKKIGILLPGQCAMTPAHGLRAKYVIHTSGPVFQDGKHGERELLYQCYRNALNMAEKQGCTTMAFPLISSGNYGYPKAEALQVAISAISSFVLEKEMMVYLVVYDRKTYGLSEKLVQRVQSFIDDHYVEEKERHFYDFSWLGQEDSSPDQAAEIDFGEPIRRRSVEPEFSKCSRPVQQSVAAAPSASLEEMLSHMEETFSQSVMKQIYERNLDEVAVYKKANLDRKLFSKIRSNVNYKPSKQTAVALALALELDFEAASSLLGKAGLAFSRSNKFDVIIEFFIHQGNYNIFEINEVLFEFDQPLLGAM